MTASNWVQVGVGGVVIAVGVAIVVFRVRLARANAAAQRATSGRLGEAIARRGATPMWTAVVGGVFILIGCGATVDGILKLAGVLAPSVPQ